MTKEEAIHVLQTMQTFYPKYKVTKEMARMLIPTLLPMDFQGVLDKLSTHVATHPYVPTLAEIAVYPKAPNEYLNNLKKWQEEAGRVPEETKKQFKKKLEFLLKKKAHHEHT